MAWETSNRRQSLPKGWPVIRRRILRRDPTCRVCDVRSSTEVDHIIRGDDHSDKNLRGLCWYCHLQKSAREGAAASAMARWEKMKARKRPPEAHPGGW